MEKSKTQALEEKIKLQKRRIKIIWGLCIVFILFVVSIVTDSKSETKAKQPNSQNLEQKIKSK